MAYINLDDILTRELEQRVRVAVREYFDDNPEVRQTIKERVTEILERYPSALHDPTIDKKIAEAILSVFQKEN